MAQNEKEQNDYRITYYNTVSSKEVDWLWYPYIPYGKITILQGDPGEGKSTMMMQLAALITNGDAMPDGSGDRIPGNVIYQAAEDGIEDTIKPRLEAAGADCSRIAFLEQSDEEPILLKVQRQNYWLLIPFRHTWEWTGKCNVQIRYVPFLGIL